MRNENKITHMTYLRVEGTLAIFSGYQEMEMTSAMNLLADLQKSTKNLPEIVFSVFEKSRECGQELFPGLIGLYNETFIPEEEANLVRAYNKGNGKKATCLDDMCLDCCEALLTPIVKKYGHDFPFSAVELLERISDPKNRKQIRQERGLMTPPVQGKLDKFMDCVKHYLGR